MGAKLISNDIRFGYGYMTKNEAEHYFAFYGQPNRNDDYFVNTEISREEYDFLCRKYPKSNKASIPNEREVSEIFRRKYIENHPMICEGWNKLASDPDVEGGHI